MQPFSAVIVTFFMNTHCVQALKDSIICSIENIDEDCQQRANITLIIYTCVIFFAVVATVMALKEYVFSHCGLFALFFFVCSVFFLLL